MYPPNYAGLFSAKYGSTIEELLRNKSRMSLVRCGLFWQCSHTGHIWFVADQQKDIPQTKSSVSTYFRTTKETCWSYCRYMIQYPHWRVIYRDIEIWPSGKLPFDCQKIAKNLTFFSKNVKFLQFFDIQLAIFRRVRSGYRDLGPFFMQSEYRYFGVKNNKSTNYCMN